MSTSYTNDVLLEKQVEPLFNATLSGGLANIFAACLVYLLLKDTDSGENALWLSLGICIFSLIRIVISNHYLTRNKYQLKTYLNAHIVLTLFIGTNWALYELMQYQTDDESLRNFVFLINFGLIAGSITTLSTYRGSYLAYLLPQAIAIFSVFIILDTEISYFMAFAFVIFMSLMISTSFNINRGHKKEIALTFNNKKLIGDLNNEIIARQAAQFELENNKRELELKVEARTRELVNINNSLERVIEKKEEAEQSLQYLAYHDELTGLPNRNTLVDRIGQSIKISSRDNQQMGILFIDLDRFKNVNDSLGHIIGDKLLQQVASRLYTTLRNHDTISRNGGDEFVVVLEKLKDSNEAIHVAKKIIKCLTDTFVIQSHKIHLGASIGISVYPTDGDTPLMLLRNADTAMYRAKQAGGNQLQFYDESMSNQLRNRLELEHELHDALEDNEFYLVYQPQISCLSGITTGFEALIRWKNKKYGEIPPALFVPLLEETGLIYSVGEWVVSEVVDFINMHHINDITISINLSALQCSSLGFVNIVKNMINIAGVNPSQVEFEITESLLINDFDKTKVFLDELHSIGCAIALDDFGTGYTSMSYLARLPIDLIKIDKTLVHDIDKNNNLKSIVKAIVTMSKGLGMKNVFEGVETIAELAVIKEMEGEIIQGYLYSKPLSADDVLKWLDVGHTIQQA